ncbi:juvenile hormone acid O-methyltransferase-like [Musca autumnalis]|uniref:juvenile hormone acid O-methyltransferase-like n=1 Tax=Musca autumnalis TaxID=221902 RepID=UPI003CEC778F
MNKPALYHKSHRAAKQDAVDLLRKHFSKLAWHVNGGDYLLDVGTGPGDLFMEEIYPCIPSSKCEHIVLSDISQDMLDFLQQNYALPMKCALRTFDIASENGLPPDLEGQFDHVTSSLVLHWIPDNRTALKNIFNLLRLDIGGDCLLTFYAYNSIFEAHCVLSASPRWSQFIKAGNYYVPPLQNSVNPKDQFQAMMVDVGFCNINMELKSSIYRYENIEHFKENIMSTCDILDFIPKNLQPEFLDDYVKVMADIAKRKRGLHGRDSECVIVADLMLVYGKRKSQK